jgi:hypothetical protein
LAEERKYNVSRFFSGNPSTVFYIAFLELKEKSDFANQLIMDLSNRGLSLNANSMGVSMTKGGMLGPRKTALGRQFSAYITSPIKNLM